MPSLSRPGRTTATFVSRDEGKTWSSPRPLFPDGRKIKVSNERAMLRTRDGAVIAAFMNLDERHWTWQNALHDAPDAKLPTYVMRSLDGGETWQDVQKLHDDWTGAIRDMTQELSLALSEDEGQTWSTPVVIAKRAGTWLAYPYAFEYEPGRIWLTTMQGAVRVEFREADFVNEVAEKQREDS